MQKWLILPGRVLESFRKVVSWIEGWVQVRNSGKCLACPEDVGELRGAGVEHNRGSLEVRLGKRAKDQWQKPSELHSLGKQEKPQPWVLEDGLKRGKNRSKKPVYSHKGLWLQQRLWYREAGRETWETFKKASESSSPVRCGEPARIPRGSWSSSLQEWVGGKVSY